MSITRTDITDIISDLKHEYEKTEILLDSRKRYVNYQQRKINAIPEWVRWVFEKTIWKNIKIK